MQNLFVVLLVAVVLLLLPVIQAQGSQTSEPIPLITNINNYADLKINEVALNQLKAITGTVTVTAVVGPYHSGKSTLLNKVFKPSKPFGVGHTVEPQTKGIWMSLTKDEQGNGHVVLDSEGFFGGFTSEQFDSKVFTIVTLLSSTLVYNSVRIIDYQSVNTVEQFSWLANLFASALRTSEINSFTPVLPLPTLIWAIQDFSLVLPVGKNSTAWLKDILSTHQQSQGQDTTLTTIFPKIVCATLAPPSASASVLQSLNTAPIETLTQEYQSDLSAFVSLLQEHRKSKVIDGAPMNSKMFVRLLRVLVAAANTDVYPTIPEMWEDLYIENGKQALREAEHVHIALMRNALRNPLNHKALNTALTNARVVAKGRINDDFFGVISRSQPVIATFENKVAEREKTYIEENERNVAQHIATIRSQVADKFISDLDNVILPETADELSATNDELVTKHLDAFNEQTSEFSDFSVTDRNREELLTTFQGSYRARFEHNSKAIDAAIVTAENTARLQFQSQFINQVTLPMVVSRMEDLYNTASTTQKNNFEKSVGKFSYVSLYPITHAGLSSSFYDALVRKLADNLQEITKLSISVVNAQMSAFNNGTTTWIREPPLSSQDLETMFTELNQRLLHIYNQTLRDYADARPTLDGYVQLSNEMMTAFVELKETNNRVLAQKLEEVARRLSSSADTAINALKLPQPEADLVKFLTHLKESKLLEYKRTLQKYENEPSMPGYIAALSTDLTTKHTETVSKNMEEQVRFLKTVFERYVEVFRLHMQQYSKKEHSVERLEEEKERALALASMELSKISGFQNEKHYSTYEKQAFHDRDVAHEQVVYDVSEHVKRVVLNEATRILQNFRIRMDESSLDKIPRSLESVKNSLATQRSLSLEEYLSVTALYRSDKSSLPGKAFTRIVTGGLQKMNENIDELEKHYNGLNQATMRRFTKSVRKNLAGDMEKSLDMTFWSEDSFNRWLYQAVSTHMVENAKFDPALQELMSRENIVVEELVKVAVSQTDPLGELDGYLDDYPEIKEKLKHIRSNIARKWTWFNVAVTAGLVAVGIYVVQQFN